MKRQKTSESVRKRMNEYMGPDSSPEATSGGPSVTQEDAEGLTCPSTSPSEWQMVWQEQRQLRLQLDGYSFTVPSLPGAAAAMPFDIVRFVELVPGDAGRHFIHNVALHMLNDNWIFFGRRDTGEWRPGKWTWQKQEPEVLLLRFAWKEGVRAKTTSFQKNALGWYVSNSHVRACQTKVLYRLPVTNTGESADLISAFSEVA